MANADSVSEPEWDEGPAPQRRNSQALNLRMGWLAGGQRAASPCDPQ